LAVASALPLNGAGPDVFSSSGRALSKVTSPGPRYLDHRTATGARAPDGGALVPLVNFMSSVTQTCSGSGCDTDPLSGNAVARVASGP
jgi:hypothetical protein